MTNLTTKEIDQLNNYAAALEDQDKITDTEFQEVFNVSKTKAKNNIALCIRRFAEERRK